MSFSISPSLLIPIQNILMSFIWFDQLTQSPHLSTYIIQEYKSPAIHGLEFDIRTKINLTNQCETHKISNKLTHSIYLYTDIVLKHRYGTLNTCLREHTHTHNMGRPATIQSYSTKYIHAYT